MLRNQNPILFKFQMTSYTPIFRDYTPTTWLVLAQPDSILTEKFKEIATSLRGETLFTFSHNEDEFVSGVTAQFELTELPALVIVDPKGSEVLNYKFEG
jgi:hypothetical protein